MWAAVYVGSEGSSVMAVGSSARGRVVGTYRAVVRSRSDRMGGWYGGGSDPLCRRRSRREVYVVVIGIKKRERGDVFQSPLCSDDLSVMGSSSVSGISVRKVSRSSQV